MDKIGKVMGYATEEDSQKTNIDKVLDEHKLDMDCKFFVLVHGIFDKSIYAKIKERSGLVKHVYIYILYIVY